MARGTGRLSGGESRVLLVAVRPEEQDVIARGLAATGALATLVAVASPAEAARAVKPGEVQAVVCSFTAFAALLESVPDLFRQETLVATLVLVPPGSEERAAPLYQHEGTDLLLQAGNYRPLLAAWLMRALARREPSWEEVGRIVRHEINNPLTGVLGNAELLLADPAPLPPQARARLRTIVDLAVRMRDVIRTLEVRLQREDTFFTGPPVSKTPELLASELTR